MRYLIFTSFIIFGFSCKTKLNNAQKFTETKNGKLVFLDSVKASMAILDDDANGIFERLTPLDISIQMQQIFEEDLPFEEKLKLYKIHIQKDVTSFEKGEQEWIQNKWDEAVQLCNAIDPNILPPSISLIRSKGTYYGPEAFFTRKNMIIIPEYNLKMRSKNGMLSVLLHEIFHIYSRNNPSIQAKLYEHIGFRSIGDSKELIMDKILADKILHNPDGLNFAWAINLKDEEKSFEAIPIISSILPSYDPSKGDFFNFMHFDLFEVQKEENKYKVICDEEGQPTLPPQSMISFFNQIGSNTQYIIHPDEILADNFMLLALSKKDASSIENLTEDGKQLLSKIESTITAQ